MDRLFYPSSHACLKLFKPPAFKHRLQVGPFSPLKPRQVSSIRDLPGHPFSVLGGHPELLRPLVLDLAEEIVHEINN